MSGFAAAALPVIGNLFGGLFGASSERKRQRRQRAEDRAWQLEDVAEQFTRHRAASEKAGFNPLSTLPFGSSGSIGPVGPGPAPLASTALIADAFAGLGDIAREFTPQAKVRDRYNEAQARLAELEVEQAEAGDAGLVGARTRTAASMPSRPGVAGMRSASNTVRMEQNGVPYEFSAPSIAPGRGVDVIKPANTPGVFTLDNNLTFGGVTLPGDTEPWGIDELATAVVLGAPQVGFNYGRKLIRGEATIPNVPKLVRSDITVKPKPKGQENSWFSIGLKGQEPWFSLGSVSRSRSRVSIPLGAGRSWNVNKSRAVRDLIGE